MVRRAPIGHQSRTVAQACALHSPLPRPEAHSPWRPRRRPVTATEFSDLLRTLAPPSVPDFGCPNRWERRAPPPVETYPQPGGRGQKEEVAVHDRHVVLTPIRPPLRYRKFANFCWREDGFELVVPLSKEPPLQDGLHEVQIVWPARAAPLGGNQKYKSASFGGRQLSSTRRAAARAMAAQTRCMVAAIRVICVKPASKA